MSDLIRRADAIEAIRTLQTFKLFAGDDMILIDKAEVQTELMTLPSADRTGKWLPDNICYYETRFVCSNCKESMRMPTIGGKPLYDFCPYCGADMRGGR